MTNQNQTKRLPPGQQLVAPGKWPIIGERKPAESEQPWSLEIAGEVAQPMSFSVAELQSFPQTERIEDIHCVTRWSMLDVRIRGVLLADLLNKVGVKEEVKFVSFVSRSERNHSTSLLIDEAIELGTLIALNINGKSLGLEHGGPIRNIVPGRYFYKSVKWLTRIDLLATDRLGYWEAETGYHNHADPWKEERYMVPSLDRRSVLRLLESRDFSGHNLRSINASERNLDGLKARGSLLRNANFENASLIGADFSGANLSNAHFEKADLRQVTFIEADLEGADFAGADLRGANLTGSSLIGSSFCNLDSGGEISAAAVIDQSTTIPPEILSPLTPTQLEYVNSRLNQ